MNESILIEKARTEIKQGNIGFTSQFLSVHELEFIENNPKVCKVSWSRENKIGLVYIKVKNEKFYFVVYIEEADGDFVVISSDTLPYVSVSFKAHSSELNLSTLSSFSVLPYTMGSDIGEEKVKNTNIRWKETRLIYEPYVEPDTLSQKLESTLNFLLTDESGIQTLIGRGKGFIDIAIEYYIGNSMLGTEIFEADHIKKIGRLGASVQFDLYVSGEKFKE